MPSRYYLFLILTVLLLAVDARSQTDSVPKPTAPKPALSPVSNLPKRPPSELQKAVQEFRVQIGQIGSGKGQEGSQKFQRLCKLLK